MNAILNVIWLIFGGFESALGYFAASLLLCLTIVGIPFALQTFKIGLFMLWPFGSRVVISVDGNGCLNSVMNVLWFFCAGVWICLLHLLFGFLLCITIIGIPFGMQHFRLARLALFPFGKEVLNFTNDND